MGLSAARKFAELGAATVLTGHHEPEAEAKALRGEGYTAISVRCDVSDPEDCRKMVEATAATFGRLDFAYNNASKKVPGLIPGAFLSLITRHMEISTFDNFFTCRFFRFTI